ncbi:hypothetical protein C1752_00051 [Acaryochloris thomasi RCC1774]|uniref:RNA-binding S4 domain-containing protein n=1 Tax=Acaryochloris thomasi RCC1774 TaxID=1764569 RepID=A0A2W1K7J7_9CYAN|nr:RNA-binding S4 domain-containing protein [Acaryochloris thomasi]PZD75531.1 hypothetical protein C1752_00051 [Acaryochloris thomasi RCC1774]
MKLDQFLKFKCLVATGGQAKYFIQNGEVEVNGHPETRRGRQLSDGDIVTFQGQSFDVGGTDG